MKRILLAAAVLISLPQCRPASSAATAPKWEYRQMTSFARSFPTEELNQLSSEGWELVHYHEERKEGYYTRFVFKRLVTSSSAPAAKEKKKAKAEAEEAPAKPAN